MIMESVHSGTYPLETDIQKKYAEFLQVTNKSEHDDLAVPGVLIETRVKELYVLNNYVPNIEHLPGVIELDVIDSFRMICRKIERIKPGLQLDRR
jgi:hypothetical protein